MCLIFSILGFLVGLFLFSAGFNPQGAGFNPPTFNTYFNIGSGIVLLAVCGVSLVRRLLDRGRRESAALQPIAPPAIQQPPDEEQTAEEAVEYLATNTELGIDAKTQDYVTLADTDRFSGMYVLGVQGVGKSSLLEQIILQDIAMKQTAVIVIDPHGDLIEEVIARLVHTEEEEAGILSRIFILDIEDVTYPFGLNLFELAENATATAQQQALDKTLHVFTKCFPETSHMLLDKYLGNIAPVFFAHANKGYGMTDISRFLRDDTFRNRLLVNPKISYFVRSFWQNEYESMSPSKRQTDTASLATRLNRFVRSPIVGGIIGQTKTTIDFRKAIENNEIIFIRLPIKTLMEDSQLIGTMLIAQIYAAIFSFADTPQEQRPGFSLFVDEFQHFVTTDFSEMFTEGRKYGSRVCIAHQYRQQLPDYLQSATMTARTKICFQTTPEDSREMAHLFLTDATEVRPEDIDPKPVDYLCTYGHDNADIQTFITWYLRPLRSMPRKNKMIEVTTWELGLGSEFLLNTMGSYVSEKPKVADPEPYLNNLLYQVEKTGTDSLAIPFEVIYGFSNCGKGYYQQFEAASKSDKTWLASGNIRFTPDLLVEISDHELRWTHPPKNSEEQLFHFLYFLRRTMAILSYDPIGEKKAKAPTEISQTLSRLPRRHAFIRTGEQTAELVTDDTPPAATSELIARRKQTIQEQTRAKYCRSIGQVEQEIMQRLGEATRERQTGQPEQEQPAAKREPEEQTAEQIPTSMDRMNVLYAQMKANEIDPDTTILASLGEHYVLTIKQWMRLFAWGSYPRATQYFKELREQGLIFHKDREGRGGKLVEGDWFFLLTKGANELVKRKQATPLFKLEPNEAEKASGDTLVHTYQLTKSLFTYVS